MCTSYHFHYLILGLRPIDLAFRNDHENVVKLLLHQDIENAFEIITKESKGIRSKSLLQEAMEHKWKKLGHLFFCGTSGKGLQVSLINYSFQLS